jgi:hypothetical protein
MGLDQYLTARRFLWIYDNGEGKDAEIGKNIRALFPEIAQYRPRNVSVEVGYWRKANAIHRWFVDNLQDGVDDCRETPVTLGALQTLLDTVNEVLADTAKADEALPTQSGFFFDSTQYDKWYQDDLIHTKNIIQGILDNKSLQDWDFYYSSSW